MCVAAMAREELLLKFTTSISTLNLVIKPATYDHHSRAAEAVTDFYAKCDAADTAKSTIPRYRWWRRSTFRRSYGTYLAACSDLLDARRELARARVGANPREWGLLSDDIESTLDFYLELDVDGGLRERLKEIARAIPQARLEAHDGDRELERKLTLDLAQCVLLEPSDREARRLVHHLPGWARPIPAVDLEAVAQRRASQGSESFDERYFYYRDPANISVSRYPVVTFYVSFKTIDTLKLHDIVVARDLSADHRSVYPTGVGSAALEHLCRSADYYGLSIVGEIMPGDRTEASAARLAGWYGRHGFGVEPRKAGEFLWAKIRRVPELGAPRGLR